MTISSEYFLIKLNHSKGIIVICGNNIVVDQRVVQLKSAMLLMLPLSLVTVIIDDIAK